MERRCRQLGGEGPDIAVGLSVRLAPGLRTERTPGRPDPNFTLERFGNAGQTQPVMLRLGGFHAEPLSPADQRCTTSARFAKGHNRKGAIAAFRSWAQPTGRSGMDKARRYSGSPDVSHSVAMSTAKAAARRRVLPMEDFHERDDSAKTVLPESR